MLGGGGGEVTHSWSWLESTVEAQTEEERIKKHAFLLVSSHWSDTQPALCAATGVSELTCRDRGVSVRSTGARLHQSTMTVARRQTHVLALKRVEEVSTQLPVIPRGAGRIANAT